MYRERKIFFFKNWRLKMFTKHKPLAGRRKGGKMQFYVPGDLDH